MEYLAKTAEALSRLDSGEIKNAVRMIQEVKKDGNIVWLVGNGGSAATAAHFAVDLQKAGVRAIALPSMVPSITAYGNDDGWQKMFSGILEVTAKHGDALVAISCGGKSVNVIMAARHFGRDRLIILTGNDFESPLAAFDADCKLFVTDEDIRVQEDAHMAACHAISGAIG
jgi:D-sedoheptulose 7-phosphate isomerase